MIWRPGYRTLACAAGTLLLLTLRAGAQQPGNAPTLRRPPLIEFGRLQRCFSGPLSPGAGHVPDSACRAEFDDDADGDVDGLDFGALFVQLDSDVDLLDLAAFQRCFRGSDVEPASIECIGPFDVDRDGDVDLFDFSWVRCAVAGPGITLPPVQVTSAPPQTTEELITISGTSAGWPLVEVAGGSAPVSAAVSDCAFSVNVPLLANRVNRLFFFGHLPDGTASAPSAVTVTHDGEAPNVFIDFPGDGSEVTTAQTDVAGRVGDMLSGFMGLTVRVNDIDAVVDVGIGNNGTFFAPGVPLKPGSNTIRAVATDVLGNVTDKSITVTRVEIPPGVAQIQVLSGNGQQGPIGSMLPDPIAVRVISAQGSPMAGKPVTLDVTRSNGRLIADGKGEGGLLLQLLTDANGEARAFWRLGSDAGWGNNRVEALSQDVFGTAVFCASASPGPAVQINVGSGGNQRAETGGLAPEPLRVWVSDSCNGVVNMPVTFQVVRGSGRVNGQSSVVVPTGGTGHAEVAFLLGPEPGNQFVEATYPGNIGPAARFVIHGVRRVPGQLTSFSGIVLDNASQPIQGATCILRVNGVFLPISQSDIQGRFTFKEVSQGGVGDLFVDGATAFFVGGQGGRSVPPTSFPALHYEPIVIVPNAANSLPTPVLLPSLNPKNVVRFDNTEDVELTVDGIEGLRMIVTAGSMTTAFGTRPDPKNPAFLALNQVRHDKVPMPMPDGAAPPFAWTLKPTGARFDPPIQIVYPNMTGLPAGAVAFFLSFNHDTGRFEIVCSGSVTDDGESIISDPGAGVSVAGWGCNCPPYSVTGSCCNCTGPCQTCQNGECVNACLGPCCEGTCCDSGQSCCAGSCCDGACCDGSCCSGPCCGGSCCSAGQSCCAGQCCEGVCCEDTCCSEGQTCCAGQCCDGDCCNSQCCGPEGQCCPSGFCCGAEEECCGAVGQSLCCGAGLQCCGEVCCSEELTCCGPGACCDPNEQCCSSGFCCGGDEECCGAAGQFLCCGQTQQCCGEVCCSIDADCCGSSACCSEDETCCGDTCCAPGEICNSTGDSGTCCPLEAPVLCNGQCCAAGACCDGSCCQEGETCCGGECCPSDAVCCPVGGDHCCAGSCCGDDCCPVEETCCGNNTCCQSMEVCCGKGISAECCQPQQECCFTSGPDPTTDCCDQGETCCAGNCCLGGQQCCTHPTLSFIGDCCEEGETCCNGSCCPPGMACAGDPPHCCGPPSGMPCGDDCCSTSDTCCGDHCCDSIITPVCCPDHCCPFGNSCCGNECCEAGQTCCPGDLGSGSCCDAGVACVDGLCCAAPMHFVCGQDCCVSGQDICCGDHCCSASLGDICCGDTCCQPSQICCGDFCCGEDETCCGDTCCPVGVPCVGEECCAEPAEVCGDECCHEFDECCPGDHCCLEGSCCGPVCCQGFLNQICCGDHCCDEGETCCGSECCSAGDQCCPGGQCCSPGATCCGDQCCFSYLEQVCCGDECCEGTCCESAPGGCCPVGQDCCGDECCGQFAECCPGNHCCTEGTCCGPVCCLSFLNQICCGDHCCDGDAGEACCGAGCCAAGQCTADGFCCASGTTVCGSACCGTTQTCCQGECCIDGQVCTPQGCTSP